MNDRVYVYAIHIATTPEKLWQALTDGDIYQQYWRGRRIESDWKVGSPVNFFAPDGKLESQGTILECRPPEALSHTWYDPADAESIASPERVSWQITPSGPGTLLLKLVHDRMSEESYQGVSQGWPASLSSLKTLLERGTPLEFARKT